jgi:hypothetical protein
VLLLEVEAAVTLPAGDAGDAVALLAALLFWPAALLLLLPLLLVAASAVPVLLPPALPAGPVAMRLSTASRASSCDDPASAALSLGKLLWLQLKARVATLAACMLRGDSCTERQGATHIIHP